MMVGDLGCVCATRIHDNDGEALGITFFAFEQALEQHGVAFGRVCSDQECHGTVIEILVATGRTVRAKAAGVAGHR